MSEYVDRHMKALLAGGWIPPEPTTAQLPDIRAENRVYAQVGSFMLLALAITAAVYAYLASPLSDRLQTGGLGRYAVVRRFYAAPPAELANKTPVLALGDSLTLEGLDCNLLDQLDPAAAPSFDLALPSKVNGEFLLDLAQPLVQRARVVTLVSPATTYCLAERSLPANRANMIRLADYPLDRAGWAAYAQLVPDSGVDYLLRPRYQHVLDSRWRIVADFEKQLKLHTPGVSAQSKQAMRYLEDVYSTDLKSAGMPTNATPDEMQHALDERARTDPGLLDGGFQPTPEALAAYSFAIQRLAAGTQGVVLVIAPLHPLLAARLGPAGVAQFKQQIQSYASDKVRVLDFSTLLDAADFRDELHPNHTGADKLTRALAAELEQRPAGAG